MPRLLVVCNATGLQGRSILSWFLKYSPTWSLRGLTRDPSSPAATSLAARGVEIVRADQNDVVSLEQAFHGAEAIFAYTTFNGIAASHFTLAAVLSGEAATIGRSAYPIELQQGRNIADAAAATQGLTRLIWSSQPDVAKWSGGRYVNVPHSDVKAHVLAYIRELPGLRGKVSAVMMGSFASNAIDAPEAFGLVKAGDGNWNLRVPIGEDTAIPWIDVHHDLGAFVHALIQAPAGQHVLGASETLSLAQWLDLVASHIGEKMRFEQIPLEIFASEDPVGLLREVAEQMLFIQDFGYSGGDPDVLGVDEFERRTGVLIPRTAIAEQIKQADWSRFA